MESELQKKRKLKAANKCAHTQSPFTSMSSSLLLKLTPSLSDCNQLFVSFPSRSFFSRCLRHSSFCSADGYRLFESDLHNLSRFLTPFFPSFKRFIDLWCRKPMTIFTRSWSSSPFRLRHEHWSLSGEVVPTRRVHFLFFSSLLHHSMVIIIATSLNTHLTNDASSAYNVNKRTNSGVLWMNGEFIV